MADRLSLPAFPRVADYGGLWAIESTAAAALQARARSTDWPTHFAAAGGADARTRSAAVPSIPTGVGTAVAVVRLEGTLMKAATSFGGTSTVQARRDLRAAAADAETVGILIVIDSPGGTVSGTDDLAREVAAAAKKKPVYAYVADLCASAAYWAASQCEKIYANSDTAWVGSIGTFMAVFDTSKAAAEQGIEAVVFRTGPLKGAGAVEGDPVTDDQRAVFQKLIEASQATFDAAVKKGRGLTEKQLAAARTGAPFTAADAVGMGLIDGVKPLDAVVAELGKVADARARAARKADSGRPGGGATMNDDVLELTPAADFTAARKLQAAELRRVAAIQDVCRDQPSVAADAIEQGWSVEKAELAAMKASMAKPTPTVNPHSTRPAAGVGGPGDDHDVVVSAMMLSLGYKPDVVAAQLPVPHRERVMNQATGRQMRGYSLHPLMDATLQAAGKSWHGNRKTDGFVRAAIEADRQLRADGGFTTVSLSNVLSNLANKVMLARYTSQNVTWDRWCAVRSHTDFKPVTRIRLDATGAFRKVGPDGELKHAGLTDAAYTNKLDTFGAIISLTRQMQINDDLQMFAELPGTIGDMAAIRVEEGAFALLMSNAGSFFAAGNNNLLTGAGSVFGGGSLTSAEALFENQVTSAGKPILTSPSVLLVPTTLRSAAETLYTSRTLIAIGQGNAAATTTSDNPHAGKYPPVVSPYLNQTAIRDQDNKAITGQSSTAWYLLADPAVRAAVAVAFLNGQRLPTIESSDTEFTTLGMQWRGYLDIGFGFEDPTAAVKSNGA